MPQHYYPSRYQEWLFAALEIRPGDEVSPAILESLHVLHRAWVHGEEIGPTDCGDDRLACAYTLYYMTVNMPKVWFLLDRCPALTGGFRSAEHSVVLADMGCGPGTCSWAALFYLLANCPESLAKVKRVIGIDLSPAALACARKLMTALPEFFPEFEHIEFEFRLGDWRESSDLPCTWMFFGNTLNESGGDDVDWIDRIANVDVLWLVEPGTTKLFHDLLPARDHLLARGWQINFPCPSHHACPMKADNWCHFHVNRFVLPFIQRISDKARRVNPRHNFVGFAFSRDVPARTDREWRVLSRLRRENRSGIRYLCDGEQMIEMVLNRREKTEGNRDFLAADAGDLIEITTAETRHGLARSPRLTRADRVQKK